MELKPIKLLPARERIAAQLRKAILSRDMKAGEIITLEGIASKTGLSIMPVREAFQILKRDGLLKQLPNRCMEVQGITRKVIRDHYETRAVLEAAAAEDVCFNKADLSEIEAAFREAEQTLKTGDSSSYSNLNQAFHNAIWTAGGNLKMKSLLAELWNGLSMGYMVTEGEYAKISIGEHRKILEALRQHNAVLAFDRMHDHITRSMENMLTNFE
jgi:DNA-binding GntR family transcriptional regulator